MAVQKLHWGARAVMAGLLATMAVPPTWTQTVPLRRGDLAREKIHTLPSERERVGMVVTVVAAPGDVIHVSDGALFVNQQPVTGFSTELIATAARSRRMPPRMTDDEYLVMGESRDSLGNVVRKWGIYARRDLEPVTGAAGR